VALAGLAVVAGLLWLTTHEAATGDPVAVRLAAFVVALGASAVVLSLPGVAAVALLPRICRGDPVRTLAVFLVGIGVGGDLLFWLVLGLPSLGHVAGPSFVAICALVVAHRPPDLDRRWRRGWALAIVVAVACSAIVFLPGGLELGGHQVIQRYWSRTTSSRGSSSSASSTAGPRVPRPSSAIGCRATAHHSRPGSC